MTLSKTDAAVLVDLIENKLAVLHIDDREDLREMIALQHCLAELKGVSFVEAGILKNLTDIPRRGRHRKMSTLINDTAMDHMDHTRHA